MIQKIDQILNQNLEFINNAMLKDKPSNAVCNGFSALDDKIGGYIPGELIIVSGHTGIGNTSFIVSKLINLGKANKKALFISLQHSAYDIGNLMLSMVSEVPKDRILKGNFNQTHLKQIIQAKESISNYPIFIADPLRHSLADLGLISKKLIDTEGIEIILIDEIQMIHNYDDEIYHLEYPYIKKLKDMAQDLNVPIVAVSNLGISEDDYHFTQMPKIIEYRKRGTDEENADMILFINRPEYYKYKVDEEGYSLDGIAYIQVVMNKLGKTGHIVLKFDHKTQLFSSE